MPLVEIRRNFFVPDRALRFGAASTDRITITAATSINDLDPFTWILWVKQRAFTDLGRLVDKGGKLWRNNGATEAATGVTRLEVPRATTATIYSWSYVVLTPLFHWRFVAATYSSAFGAGQNAPAYGGTLHDDFVVELPLQATTNGSGTTTADAANNLCLGNRNAGDRICNCDIAFFSCWNRALNPSEIKDQFLHPSVGSGCVVFMLPGDNGTGTQTDFSGNGNTGAVTGATVVDGPARAYSFDIPKGGPNAGWEQLLGMKRRRLVGAY